MSLITRKSSQSSILRPVALTSGTLPSKDVQATRRFYEEVLGLDVAVKSPTELVIRLGGDHTYLVEEASGRSDRMVLLNHNGFYLEEDQSVDDAYAKMCAARAAFELKEVTKPTWQHGYYAFFVQDADGNWWEFHHAPRGQRQDLSDGPDMTTEDSRKWFSARRGNIKAASQAGAE